MQNIAVFLSNSSISPSEFTDSYPELIGFSTGNQPERLYGEE
ncbi:hypothetical protein HMPREF2531_01838 [Bacteroides intestinalis]|uniref:Uncharacterized protein n=2 Tax=Bacteroides TaxID=816 RepID=A0A139LJJ9_9BACE|nr:hypothetical protein BACCELL_02289 [Bacteroides cellulosilyticus DSM 14838]KXT51585.1 hypothetical protein HMPREF2531_01838 [Bacteroides intestinalis]